MCTPEEREELNMMLRTGEKHAEALLIHLADMGAGKVTIPITLIHNSKLVNGKVTAEIIK